MEQRKQFNTTSRINVVDRFSDTVYDKASIGVDGVVDMSTRGGDFKVSDLGLKANELPEYFLLIPETTGQIVVNLEADLSTNTYTITKTQIANQIGMILPYKVDRVFKNGTTAKFSIVW